MVKCIRCLKEEARSDCVQECIGCMAERFIKKNKTIFDRLAEL